jgi:hypothetical protein
MSDFGSCKTGFFGGGGGGGGGANSAVIILGTGTKSNVRCGVNNTASATYSSAFGGCNNNATGCFSVVLSGFGNVAAGTDTLIGVGLNNTNNGCRSVILGGNNNQMNALGGFIATGNCNSVCNTGGSSCARSAIVVSGVGNNSSGGVYSPALCCFTSPPTLLNAGGYSFIGTGFQNSASGCYSTVVSGFCNYSSNIASFIGSGCCNIASGCYGAIVSGFCNTASGCTAVVTGGHCNVASTLDSNIAGGSNNCIIGAGCCSTISGGFVNTACGTASYIGGGTTNLTRGLYSSVTAGFGNVSQGDYSSVDGGIKNYAQGISSSILGGNCNYVCNLTSGCLAYGGVVVGGVGNNTTGGTWTLASCCFTVAPTICNAGSMSFIGGGFQNNAKGDCSAILGGSSNVVTAAFSGAFGCGVTNSVACSFASNRLIATNLAIAGCGVCSDANGMLLPFTAAANPIYILGTGPNSSVRCGVNNLAQGDYSAVLGGFCNNFCNSAASCLVTGSVVVGGIGNNTIGGTWSIPLSCFTVAPTAICNGGFSSFIGGGFQNVAKCDYNSILGGYCNVTTGLYSGAFGFCVTNTVACSFASNRLIATNLATAGCGVCTDANGMLLPYTPSANVFVCTSLGNICAPNTGNAIILTGPVCYNSILGGSNNTMSSYGPAYNVIAGGRLNSIVNSQTCKSSIGGGESNGVYRPYGAITGGKSNTNSSYFGNIGGGNGNATNYCGDGATIGGGCVNYADSHFAFIGGGSCNNIQWTPNNNLSSCALGAAVVGGVGNNTTGGTWTIGSCAFTVAPTPVSAGQFSTIGGGLQNRATGFFSSVLGGNNNGVGEVYGAIVGGQTNTICTASCFSFIGGGYCNVACGNNVVIVGGHNNTVIGNGSFSGAGFNNTTCGSGAFNGAGQGNLVQAIGGVVVGGNCNSVCNTTSGCLAYGAAVVGGVGNNTTGGTFTIASCAFTVSPTICNAGQFSFVGGGFQNIASGLNSGVLGGTTNNTCGFANSFIVGSNINANAVCTTYVNNLCSIARINANGAVDNSIFSVNTLGTINSNGLSFTGATCATTLSLDTNTVFVFVGGSGVTWTLSNPSGNNRITYVKNSGTGILTVAAFAGTNIIDNTASSVASVTIGIGATGIFWLDGNVKAYQLQ